MEKRENLQCFASVSFVPLIVSPLPHSKTELTSFDSDPVVEEITFDEDLFGALTQKFVELGTPMKEMWRLVMPQIPDLLHGFGTKPETMTNLKNLLLSQTAVALREGHRSWACDALEKALNPHETRLYFFSAAHRNRLRFSEEGWEDEAESSDDEPDDTQALCYSTRILDPDTGSELDPRSYITDFRRRIQGSRITDPHRRVLQTRVTRPMSGVVRSYGPVAGVSRT
jgi:hypothetical protein